MTTKKSKTTTSFELIRTYAWIVKASFVNSPIQAVLYLTFAVIQITANLASIFVGAKMSAALVDAIGHRADSSRVWHWLILVIVASIVGNGAYRAMEIVTQFSYYRMVRWSTESYLQQLCRIDMADFYDATIRNQINKINSGFTWRVANASNNSMRLIQSGINLLATIITIGIIAWWITPLFIVLLIPVFIYEARMAKVAWFVWDEQDDKQHIFWGVISVFQQAKKQFEVRALTASDRLLNIAKGLNKDFYSGQEKSVKKLNPLAMLTVLLQVARESLAQVWLLQRTIAGKLALDQYFFYASVVLRLDGAIYGFFGNLAHLQGDLKFTSDYRQFMSIRPTIVDAPDALLLDNTKSPTLEFRDATFTYPGAESPAFEHLSLTINAGEKVALVGENGAGKSTIVKLLMRFYYLDSGDLLINGVSIRDIAIDTWLRQVAVLFQDFNQYPLTVSDNIAISGIKKSKKEVERAARLSGADAFIHKLPHKFDTYLDPAFKKGAEPSGGQWQRIALARAFYRKANMIVLDEPTSAIDAKAEYEIFNNIFTEHDGKTALIVSHRFSTVRKADRIIVLNDGHIVENGTHEELMALKGRYADMFNKQAEGYR
jgi:ABC-type multidrug transport system fused ATPase/permease subunit